MGLNAWLERGSIDGQFCILWLRTKERGRGTEGERGMEGERKRETEREREMERERS